MNSTNGLQNTLRYRLYADGTVVDQKLGKTVGYIDSRVDLDKAWKMHPRERQTFIKEYLSLS